MTEMVRSHLRRKVEKEKQTPRGHCESTEHRLTVKLSTSASANLSTQQPLFSKLPVTSFPSSAFFFFFFPRAAQLNNSSQPPRQAERVRQEDACCVTCLRSGAEKANLEPEASLSAVFIIFIFERVFSSVQVCPIVCNESAQNCKLHLHLLVL